MINNDGSCTNEEAFWKYFTAEYGIRREEYEPIFREFYRNEFNYAIDATQPSPYAKEAIDACVEKGFDIYLATNPFYRELIARHNIDPSQSMMVGNDVEEDMIAGQLGFETYLITDCLLNKKNLPVNADHQGTLKQFRDYIRNMDV